MVVNENEVCYTIDRVFRTKGVGISCLAALSRGGIVAASDRGEFALWLRNEEVVTVGGKTYGNSNNNSVGSLNQGQNQEKLIYMRSWDSQRYVPAIHMDLSANDDYLAISFKNNDISYFQLNKILPLNSESVESMS